MSTVTVPVASQPTAFLDVNPLISLVCARAPGEEEQRDSVNGLSIFYEDEDDSYHTDEEDDEDLEEDDEEDEDEEEGREGEDGDGETGEALGIWMAGRVAEGMEPRVFLRRTTHLWPISALSLDGLSHPTIPFFPRRR